MAVFNKSTTIINDDNRGKIRIYNIDNGSSKKIREAIKNNSIEYTIYILKEGERIDAIAGRVYKDSTQWRVIAAANGIGFILQVKAGSQLFIPTNLSEVYSLL